MHARVKSPLRLIKPVPALIVALCAAVLLAVAFAWDAEVVSWQRGLDSPVRGLADTLSDYGDWPWLMALGLSLCALSLHVRFRALRRVAVCMMLASTLAGAAANVLKNTVGRTRPNAQHVEHGWHGPFHQGQLIVGKSKFGSFPSGHTAAAVGFFGCLLLLRWPFPLAGIALVWIVPAARIVSGAHHPSDVAASVILGLLCALYVRHVRADEWAAPLLDAARRLRLLPENRGTSTS